MAPRLLQPVEFGCRPLSRCEARAWLARLEKADPTLGPFDACPELVDYVVDCHARYHHRGAHDHLDQLCRSLRPVTADEARAWLKENEDPLVAGAEIPLPSECEALVDVIVRCYGRWPAGQAFEAVFRLCDELRRWQAVRPEQDVAHRLRARRRREGSPRGPNGEIENVDVWAADHYLAHDNGRTGAHNPLDGAACRAIGAAMPRGQGERYAAIAKLVSFTGRSVSRQGARSLLERSRDAAQHSKTDAAL